MILVTGGTGLLGSHLLFELATSGHTVRAIKRRSSDTGIVRKIFSYYAGNPDELLKKIEWFEADLMDFGAMEDSMKGITEIYHAGAIVSFSPKDHKAMLRVNVDGTANLINLSLDYQVRKFCFVSSIAALGRAEHSGIIDEETYWKYSKKNSVYSVSKYGAEREVWRGIEEGLNAVIINPSIILGPGFWEDSSGLFLLVWQGLKYYTLGTNGFVDVNDLVKALIQTMERNLFRERFIVSSENVTYRELFSWMAKYLGKPAPSINVPPVLTHLAWRIEKIKSLLARSNPKVTKELASASIQNYYYSNDKIRKALDFKFMPVEESVRRTCGIFLRENS